MLKLKLKYKNTKITIDGVQFDSKIEHKYYQYLLSTYAKDDIALQPLFILQDKFKYQGKTIRAITYTGDFQIENNIYDVKGQVLPLFKLKAKMFKYKYPHLNLIIVQWKNKQWIES